MQRMNAGTLVGVMTLVLMAGCGGYEGDEQLNGVPDETAEVSNAIAAGRNRLLNVGTGLCLQGRGTSLWTTTCAAIPEQWFDVGLVQVCENGICKWIAVYRHVATNQYLRRSNGLVVLGASPMWFSQTPKNDLKASATTCINRYLQTVPCSGSDYQRWLGVFPG